MYLLLRGSVDLLWLAAGHGDLLALLVVDRLAVIPGIGLAVGGGLDLDKEGDVLFTALCTDDNLHNNSPRRSWCWSF